jgi:hypothetical protein
MSPEELRGKIITGELHEDNVKTEFCDEYQSMVDHLAGRK